MAVRRPITVDPCGCGSQLVDTDDDGTSVKYRCTCGELLADLIPSTCP